MDRRALPLGVAGVLWVFAVYNLAILGIHAFRGTVSESPLVGAILRQSAGGSLWVSSALIGVFSWITALVLFRAIRIMREELAVGMLTASRGRVDSSLRAGRRAMLMSDHAQTPARLAELLPGSSALDAAALDNSYFSLRALVWALPVLGFIGTANEMAHSIRGFSDALSLSSEGKAAIAVVTDRMAQIVIPGLANAFAITMLALGASVVAHWWVVSLHSWDRGALERLDRTSIAELGRRLPADWGAGGKLPDISQLLMAIGVLTAEMKTLSGKLDIADAGARLERASTAVTNSAGELTKAAGRLSGAADEVVAATKGPYHITLARGAGQ